MALAAVLLRRWRCWNLRVPPAPRSLGAQGSIVNAQFLDESVETIRTGKRSLVVADNQIAGGGRMSPCQRTTGTAQLAIQVESLLVAVVTGRDVMPLLVRTGLPL